eukprot:gb/GEZN01019638.1/.p1 GENE.gb/GEZN01019638.1/~~gb/GEZN01019638.1/.p1  ORF type:complete len:145 (+),score=27.06 gb/GEZN01019638.1/:61-495(+)
MASLRSSEPLKVSQEVDETLGRILSSGKVQAVLLANSEGRPLRSVAGMDDELTGEYTAGATMINKAVMAAIAKTDPDDEVTLIRISTKKREILIVPDKNYSMVVLQSSSSGTGPQSASRSAARPQSATRTTPDSSSGTTPKPGS